MDTPLWPAAAPPAPWKSLQEMVAQGIVPSAGQLLALLQQVGAVTSATMIQTGPGLTGGPLPGSAELRLADVPAKHVLANMSDIVAPPVPTPTDNLGWVRSERVIQAGTGLEGGGDLSANRILALHAINPTGDGIRPTVDVFGRVTELAPLRHDDVTNALGYVPPLPFPSMQALRDYDGIAIAADVAARTTFGDQGGGRFRFVTGSQSANVAADPCSGVWVAPSRDPTGASGAWQRQFSGSVSPYWFGAKQDGVTDDWAALQGALDWIGRYGGTVEATGNGTFLISLGLQMKPRVSDGFDGDISPPSNILFNKGTKPLVFRATAGACIKATASMVSMLTIVGDTALNPHQLAPYFSEVTGFVWAANALATHVISSQSGWCNIHRNRIDNPGGTGIRCNVDNGVHDIWFNVIRAQTCIDMRTGGNDSMVRFNDFYPGADGILLNVRGNGNIEIAGNSFTNEGGGTAYGVRFANAGAMPYTMAHIEIVRNSFAGLTAGVYGVANATYKALQGTIAGNYVVSFGGTTAYTLADLTYCQDWTIEGNFVGLPTQAASTTPGLKLTNCVGMSVVGGHFVNFAVTSVQLSDCVDTTFIGTQWRNCGLTSGSNTVVALFGTTLRTKFIGCRISQDDASFGQFGITEAGGSACDGTEIISLTTRNVATPANFVGPNSRVINERKLGVGISISTASGVTLTVAQIMSPVIVRTGGGGANFTDTTPTAAQIVAAIPNCIIGSWTDCLLINATAFVQTIQGGSGVFVGGDSTIDGGTSRLARVIVNNISSGAESVSVFL